MSDNLALWSLWHSQLIPALITKCVWYWSHTVCSTHLYLYAYKNIPSRQRHHYYLMHLETLTYYWCKSHHPLSVKSLFTQEIINQSISLESKLRQGSLVVTMLPEVTLYQYEYKNTHACHKNEGGTINIAHLLTAGSSNPVAGIVIWQ